MTAEPSTPFGRRLRNARIAAGLTLVDVAATVGCSQPAVSRWETGDRQPPLDRLAALAEAVGTTVAHLVGGAPRDGADAYGAGFRDGWHACAQAVTRAVATPNPSNQEPS